MANDQDFPSREITTASGTRGAWRHVQVRMLNEVPPLLDLIRAEMELLGYSTRDVLAARIGLEEALVNAIKHGNQQDPDKWVRMRYQLTAELLTAEIVDQGRGFQPDLLPDPFTPENLLRPSGRGIFLMRAYLTWIRFNATGNGVTLCKRRAGRGTPALPRN